MASTIVPEAADRPNVLPSERLLANGMAIPALRADLRRIDNVRNAVSVATVWFWVALIIGGAVWLDQWWGYLIAFVLMGPMYARFAILMHEAAHKLLFTNKRWNDWIGKWVVAYPVFTPVQLYRRVHFAHHKDEFGPDEPDIAFYSPYPCTRRALRRRLFRDAVGISGWKNFVPLVKNTRSKPFRPIGLSIFGVQALLWAAMWIATGRWWIYPLLWFLPWMTEWRVINRLRSIAEHGGMERSPDRRATTHNVRQSWLARFWIVPYNTGWHLAHHVDMGVPWRNLPAFHAELERRRLHHRRHHLQELLGAVEGAVERRRDDRGQGRRRLISASSTMRPLVSAPARRGTDRRCRASGRGNTRSRPVLSCAGVRLPAAAGSWWRRCCSPRTTPGRRPPRTGRRSSSSPAFSSSVSSPTGTVSLPPVATLLARLTPNGVLLYAGTAVLVVTVTTLLNLDTSVTFLTPVLVYAARSRGEGEAPLLYACLLLSNAGSLLLPGSNLTNLIVLGHLHLSGRAFLAHMALPALAAAAVTALVVGVVHHRALRTTSAADHRAGAPRARRRPAGDRGRHRARAGAARAGAPGRRGRRAWPSLLRCVTGAGSRAGTVGADLGPGALADPRRPRPGRALRPRRGAGHARALVVGSRHPALPSRRLGHRSRRRR